MKRLVLVRHSDAEPGSFSASDFGRSLTIQGKNKINFQAHKLKDKSLIPDLIITSTALRAEETTSILAPVINTYVDIQKEPFLYEDFSSTEFFDMINRIDETVETVFVVGHNPTISLMASRLDTNALLSFKPGSVAVFAIEKKWSLVEVNDGLLSDYISG